MKAITFYIISLTLIGCSSKVKDKSETIDSLGQPSIVMKNFEQYTLSDTITADLDGDSISDQAYFRISSSKKTIIVKNGKTNKETRIGLDKSFKDMGSNFNWVDKWGTISDNEVYENVIRNGEVIGGKKVKLTNKSLFVGKDDAGGGIITFKDGKFIWIHQAD